MRKNIGKMAILAVASTCISGAVFAQSDMTETYVPTIWVDPDGCEHWVFDDGFEGFMTPNVTRDGLPVCQRGSLCLVENSDQLFETASAVISANGRASLEEFFRTQNSAEYLISGHTDSDGGDAYNMSLGQRRADAVAEIARSVGAGVTKTRSYGERVPVASNDTAEGKAQNRRVEIQCAAETYGGKL
ncbi:membrane protein [Amylibacter ulvae]|uniref:Membrane protein n=1 Tax=Paramylibacter ulvae TaxID=1651968 RepID=A0ABQ3D4P8_9RHOB|nr:membrane protein [Amylibacter ulvae]